MAYAGMRGTGDWVTDQRPFHWRKEMLRVWPQGNMPITAMTSNMRSVVVDDPKFNRWQKVFPAQAATLTGDGVYEDAGLTTAYSSGDSYSAGQVVYCKMSLASVKEFRVRHYVLLRASSSVDVDKRGEVVSVVRDGDDSYIGVELLEDDNTSGYDLSNVNRVLIIGNLNPEAAEPPAPIAYDPSSDYNYTQIFWNTLMQTGTAIAVGGSLRTPDDYLEAKMDCWELHGVEMEKSFLYAERLETTDPVNGQKKRATRGLIKAIQEDDWAGTNCVKDFTTTTTISDDTAGDDHDYSGDLWTQSGGRFINYYLKNRARYSKTRKVLGICGDGALLGIQQIVEENGMMTIETRQVDYGIEVVRWISVFGTIDLLIHPLFSHEPTDNYRLVIYEPKELMIRPLKGRDTRFLKDPNFNKGGENAIDAKNEGYRSEVGLDFGNLRGCCVLDGIGRDNTQG